MQHKLPRLVVTRLPFPIMRGSRSPKRLYDAQIGRPGIPLAGPAAERPLRLVYR